MGLRMNGRIMALAGVLVPLLALFIYAAVRTGPLAPVPVTVTEVKAGTIEPVLFGIGTVEARYTYRIGPTAPGRVQSILVDVGETVRKGQILGEMDPVDLDERITAQEAALKRAASAVLSAEASVRDGSASLAYAKRQAERNDRLLETGIISVSAAEGYRRELETAEAGLAAAKAGLDAAEHELERLRSEREGLLKQRANLRLISPVDGLVSARKADAGSTLVAGQALVEVIDPGSIWISARFDQLGSSGLRAGIKARIVLRSRAGVAAGRVLRVEPTADPVTEETLAKVGFDDLNGALPPIGELAEVTVTLPRPPESMIVPDASLKSINGRTGVWVLDEGGRPRFAHVRTGSNDLDGRVQIIEGLKPGDRVIVYSHRSIGEGSRIKVVESLMGASPS